MAIMAQGCYIAVNRIIIMNCSAFCRCHLYLIVTHHRSDSKGPTVISYRKYSLKNDAMARPSRIMKSHVSMTPNMNLQKGILTPKHRLGQPRGSTLQDRRQLLRCVHNCRTKPATAPQRRMAADTNVPLSRRLINNRLVQSEHYTLKVFLGST